MKQITFFLCLLFSINLNSYSQMAAPHENKQFLVSVKLKNNSLLPTKVTVISYLPGQTENGTNGFFLFSYGSKSFSFPVGTKIYLASSKQVKTVMSGAKINDQEPFLLVRKEDAGKSFNVN